MKKENSFEKIMNQLLLIILKTLLICWDVYIISFYTKKT